MISVDTNVLARFYVDDPDDPESVRQSPVARRIMLESQAVFVPLTAVLELEWVMRGLYEAEPASFCDSMSHLLGMPHVTVEHWEAVSDAVGLHRRGFDFADALRWVSSAASDRMLTFDRRFAQRARRSKLTPEVVLAG